MFGWAGIVNLNKCGISELFIHLGGVYVYVCLFDCFGACLNNVGRVCKTWFSGAALWFGMHPPRLAKVKSTSVVADGQHPRFFILRGMQIARFAVSRSSSQLWSKSGQNWVDMVKE